MAALRTVTCPNGHETATRSNKRRDLWLCLICMTRFTRAPAVVEKEADPPEEPVAPPEEQEEGPAEAEV